MKRLTSVIISLLFWFPSTTLPAETPRSPADTLELFEYGITISSEAHLAVKEAEISRAVAIKFSLGQISTTSAIAHNGKVLLVVYADGKTELWQITNVLSAIKVKPLDTATQGTPGAGMFVGYSCYGPGLTFTLEGYSYQGCAESGWCGPRTTVYDKLIVSGEPQTCTYGLDLSGSFSP